MKTKILTIIICGLLIFTTGCGNKESNNDNKGSNVNNNVDSINEINDTKKDNITENDQTESGVSIKVTSVKKLPINTYLTSSLVESKDKELKYRSDWFDTQKLYQLDRNNCSIIYVNADVRNYTSNLVYTKDIFYNVELDGQKVDSNTIMELHLYNENIGLKRGDAVRYVGTRTLNNLTYCYVIPNSTKTMKLYYEDKVILEFNNQNTQTETIASEWLNPDFTNKDPIKK